MNSGSVSYFLLGLIAVTIWFDLYRSEKWAELVLLTAGIVHQTYLVAKR